VTKARAWARGQQILNPPPELLLYISCKNWGVFPDEGGWYDQNPYVCEVFGFIDNIVAEEENRKMDKAKRQSRTK